MTVSAHRLRVIYAFDTMADVRFVEGFARIFDLRLLARDPGSPIVNSPPSPPVPGVMVSGTRLRYVVSAIRWLVRHRSEYDLVIALDNVSAALAANVSRLLTRKPVINTIGKPTLAYFRCKRPQLSPLKYWLGYLILVAITRFNERIASSNGCVSHATAATTRGRKTVIPYYGVDTKLFTPDGTRQQAREALGLPADKPILLCRSRIAPEKDPDTFLAAVSLLRSREHKAVVMYVGGEAQEFASLAERFEVPVLTRGHVHPQKELPLYYQAADVVIQTSKEEGLGISPLEALVCGTPVIASAVGGLMETIRPGDTGWLVPVGDADSLARTILEVLEDPSEAARRVANGRAMVEQEYSAELAFARWNALAESVCGRSRGRE